MLPEAVQDALPEALNALVHIRRDGQETVGRRRASPEERKKVFGQHDHVRIYGLDYKDRLIAAGFDVELNNFALEMTESEKCRFGFGAGESLYIVRKSD